MSLLPADELKKIEDKVERGEMTVDFYDILGEVQKNKPAAQAETESIAQHMYFFL